MSTSEKELERYKRIEETAAAVSKQFPGRSGENDDLFELRKALKPLQTPLVSVDEIYAVTEYSDFKGQRKLGALYLRKMLDDLRQYALDTKEQGCAVAAWVSNRMCERWEEEETPDDK